VLRVTNTGLSALISVEGEVQDLTGPFQADVRVWKNYAEQRRDTFYTRHGDLFVYVCAVMTALILVGTLGRRRYI
jgi:apolipoprotein N-acyltransferase